MIDKLKLPGGVELTATVSPATSKILIAEEAAELIATLHRNFNEWPKELLLMEGQINLRGAIRRTIEFKSSEGKEYRLKDRVAVLFVRPRGWHLPEKHLLVDGEPVSGSIFDFAL
jgi:malate synthase